jgi:hypothetical protein
MLSFDAYRYRLVIAERMTVVAWRVTMMYHHPSSPPPSSLPSIFVLSHSFYVAGPFSSDLASIRSSSALLYQVLL